jgi:hypothetical protein
VYVDCLNELQELKHFVGGREFDAKTFDSIFVFTCCIGYIAVNGSIFLILNKAGWLD